MMSRHLWSLVLSEQYFMSILAQTYIVVVVEQVTSSAPTNSVTAALAWRTSPDTPAVKETGSGVTVVVVVAVPQVVVV